MPKNGLFIGLITLDFAYLVTDYPSQNQKIVAADSITAAGGPATNAAVTFSYLGNKSMLLGVLGCHPITQLIKADLEECKVSLTDLEPMHIDSPPVSSIIITQSSANRAVISINATKSQSSQRIDPDMLKGVDIILIDGHQMAASKEIAQIAKSNNIPIVVDAGSWKAGFEQILPLVDYTICSANFYPPNCHNSKEVFAYLSEIGIPHIAITCGEKPIQYLSGSISGIIEVPQINPVDTLGAGDIFHGAFCHYILQTNFTEALAAATKVASHSCQFFGTRRWMENRHFTKFRL
ncbi:sugar kinase [Kamptonema sp. UHCC 0994]|uniref:sugar kinase n=1 Tax=Kamptonema sp. UHCC 0994 TaxID=3031329 RepID=UPI0023B89857|nr:sugar kinase [Kamptonema sp. UHCC 0994]MDF0556038.1 sugar kinase [Kamptonema sp. UHCC 0994]